ncbi:protein of unknown function [Methanocaldococcus lauensis]|uniref:Uncharacterized protein n=1 Tax=Methanocaldococcus lauensis TaxID=2546128 RepID=A0A8D6SVZ7_9EURY|nr:hypothetical protein [Methanocaldococcus lauensis]CAB3288894.1 protein of unknown function [Methanocaldococcus lauensis]
MGQTVNGKKLPKIIDDADELKEIIKKAIKENENKFFEDKNDNLKIKYNHTKNGKIIEIVLMFQKDEKTGAYKLMTMYPEKGEGVYMYAPKKPNEKWKTWKRNDNGELVETWTN